MSLLSTPLPNGRSMPLNDDTRLGLLIKFLYNDKYFSTKLLLPMHPPPRTARFLLFVYLCGQFSTRKRVGSGNRKLSSLGNTFQNVVLKTKNSYKYCRVPQWMSPRRNWDSPPPPLQTGEGGQTCLRVRGWGSPNSEDRRKSLALCLLCDNYHSRILYCTCCTMYSLLSSK